MSKQISYFTAALSLLIFTACNTIDSVKPGKGSKFFVSGHTYDQVWKASVAVVGRQLDIVEESKSAGTIKSESRARFPSYGEVVGVFITPAGVDAAGYEIEVVSLKRDALQITARDWTDRVAAALKAELQ